MIGIDYPPWCYIILTKWEANKEAQSRFSSHEDWWHIFHGWRPRNKHCCIKHSWWWGRTPLACFFVLEHITFFPCGSSARQGSCLGCMEFSKQKCMTSDHTLASGWGFGWLRFGILTPATNKDPLLFDYISQLWEPQGSVNVFVVFPCLPSTESVGSRDHLSGPLYFLQLEVPKFLARNQSDEGGAS